MEMFGSLTKEEWERLPRTINNILWSLFCGTDIAIHPFYNFIVKSQNLSGIYMQAYLPLLFSIIISGFRYTSYDVVVSLPFITFSSAYYYQTNLCSCSVLVLIPYFEIPSSLYVLSKV